VGRLQSKMKKISIAIGIVVSLISIVGALFLLDARWTKASTTIEIKEALCNKDGELLNKIAGNRKRMEQYIAQDRYNWLEERKYKLEDRYENKPMPQTVKEEYRKLISEMKSIEKSLYKNP
jgi:hypothetical protein